MNNKESTVVILDVGLGAEELTKKAAECSLEIIKNKIYNYKGDMLSFLLMRTESTENVGNREEPDQYLNITQVLPGSQVPTWYMAKMFVKALECKRTKDGDWVDALVVAIGIITEDAAIHKARLSKIVLFHDFDSVPSSLDDAIVAKLNEMELKLIIVSNNIHYVPENDGSLRPQFKAIIDKNPAQIKNEELAMKLLKVYPRTTFCNFNDALSIILRKELTRPWTWCTTLAIGSRIVIQITGVIAIKKEANAPTFKKKSKDVNKFITREKKYFSGVDELPANDDNMDDRITGYMLGNTPMPYDPSLGQAAQVDTKRGVHFIGFVAADSVPQEHFTGQSTYVVFPTKGKRVSAQMMDSLVRVMMNGNLAILAWKVHNSRNKPKLVVLLPTLEYEVAALSMIELSYNSQHRYWDFPRLSTRKNQPTDEQLAAVDELMAAMDLSPPRDEDEKPSETICRDLLPFDCLPNVRQQHLIDFIANSVLKQSSPSPNFIKVPEAFQPNASAAAANVKTLFPLTKAESTTKEKLKKHFTAGDPEANGAATTSAAALEEEFKLTHVGTVNPAEDFTALIAHIMQRMSNGAERSAKFHQYASQMRSVISDLLFKSMIKQNEKVQKAIVAYRKLSIAANSSYDYNDWMRDIRLKVVERKMFDFWEEVIVQQKLGLCMEDDAQVVEEFYDISREIAAATNLTTAMEDDESVEDLFGNM